IHIQADSDLDDLKSSLCEPGTLLKDLTTTYTAPLIVRYPVSNSILPAKQMTNFISLQSLVIFRCNLSTKWFRCSFPHTSGLWYLVRACCQQKFESLLTDVPYCFIYNEDKDDEELIENEYQFNIAVSKIKPNEENKREISFSIRIKGRKAYGDWELTEVLQQFLKRQGSSLADLDQFNLVIFFVIAYSELLDQDPPIDSKALQMFIKDLEQKKSNFRVVNANEMTCREFISSFMNSEVTHVRSKESELQLKAEEWINGSRGYGPVDYSVNLGEVILLVEKAKKENFEKGVAQNIVQMHSAIE
ncbi:3451_t:CDS:2, partial [Gigaspora margarita]